MAARAEWTLRVRFHGRPHTVKVLVYLTQAEMRNAANRGRRGDPNTSSDATAGLCRSWAGDSNPAATIYHNLEHMGLNVVIHELVHAAQHIYRRGALTDPATVLIPERAWDHMHGANEDFAHLVSTLWDETDEHMRAAGLYLEIREQK